jgi:hypothetical protein
VKPRALVKIGEAARQLVWRPYLVARRLLCALGGHRPARGGSYWGEFGTAYWWECRCGQKWDSTP